MSMGCLRCLRPKEDWAGLRRLEKVWGGLYRSEEVWGRLRRSEEGWGGLRGSEEVWGGLRGSEGVWGGLRRFEKVWGGLRREAWSLQWYCDMKHVLTVTVTVTRFKKIDILCRRSRLAFQVWTMDVKDASACKSHSLGHTHYLVKTSGLSLRFRLYLSVMQSPSLKGSLHGRNKLWSTCCIVDGGF